MRVLLSLWLLLLLLLLVERRYASSSSRRRLVLLAPREYTRNDAAASLLMHLSHAGSINDSDIAQVTYRPPASAASLSTSALSAAASRLQWPLARLRDGACLAVLLLPEGAARAAGVEAALAIALAAVAHGLYWLLRGDRAVAAVAQWVLAALLAACVVAAAFEAFAALRRAPPAGAGGAAFRDIDEVLRVCLCFVLRCIVS